MAQQRKRSTPDTRAADSRKKTEGIRRKYKVRKHVKLLPSEVPHVEQMIVVLKLASYSQVQIAKIIGISREQVREILDKPAVQEEINILRAKLPAAATELLQDFMIEAVMTYVDVMRTAENDKTRIEAANEILDRGGIPKVSRSERHNINDERTTITDDGIVERLRDAPIEVQEKAAQLIEGLESLLAEASQVSEDDDATD
jgi:hypothetical protein